MQKLKTQLKTLPTKTLNGRQYLSYQAVTETVAAFLFPHRPIEQMDAHIYQQLLKTADNLCRECGYHEVVKLTPPDVDFIDMGLYWSTTSHSDEIPDTTLIHSGPSQVDMLANGQLLDARLSQLGLDEVTRQHFKIPVTASDGVLDLMRRAVESDWPNDYKGIWHDILGMCIASGQESGYNERLFTVIIRVPGRRRYWQFKAQLQQDHNQALFLYISLADEKPTNPENLFLLGHLVMTTGAAALGIDFAPYISRHARGDWGDQLDTFDKQQNDLAVKEGYRILSAYDVPVGDKATARIWIITEADRSVTTILLPQEY